MHEFFLYGDKIVIFVGGIFSSLNFNKTSSSFFTSSSLSLYNLYSTGIPSILSATTIGLLNLKISDISLAIGLVFLQFIFNLNLLKSPLSLSIFIIFS